MHLVEHLARPADVLLHHRAEVGVLVKIEVKAGELTAQFVAGHLGGVAGGGVTQFGELDSGSDGSSGIYRLAHGDAEFAAEMAYRRPLLIREVAARDEAVAYIAQ